jgi:hypothetical protein
MDILTKTKNIISAEDYLKLDNQDIICISVMDWDWPFPTSRHNLMHEFARTNRVLFVDPPMHYLSDYRTLLHESPQRHKFARSLAGRLIEREPNLFSYTPPPVAPFNRLPGSLLQPVLKGNSWVFRQAVKAAAQHLGMRRPLLWISFNPYFGTAVCGSLNEQLVLYHCTDEVAHFPGYSPQIIDIEHKLIRSSDLVITTSQVLQKTKKSYNPKTFFVPNGANVALFQQARNTSLPIPTDLTAIPEPRVVFTGQIEFRFDIQLLVEVARRRPNISFVIIGQEKSRWVGEFDPLHKEPNIYFLGNKPQTELPNYMRGMKAALIPYKLNDLTRSIYPLKLHEYFAAGQRIVATSLPSLIPFGDLVLIGDTPDDFVVALDRAIAESEDPAILERQLKTANCHSWQQVAGKISELVVDSLATKGK